jgi:riboflavin kinase/FMN adenylyltransferase
VLRPGTPPRLITTIDERVALLDALGVDRVGVLDLAEIKEQAPTSFVRDVLVDKLNVAQMVVGDDFRFGKDRTGDIDLLFRLGESLGFVVDPIGLIADSTGNVSSSRVRELIEAGEVADAALLLGSRFTVTNTVIDGDKRGRQLGFPTANISPPRRKVIPAAGVYACFARLGDDTLGAAVNVGFRPTFDGSTLLIEAFLLDFDADVYGRSLTLEFVEYLRPELRFDAVTALVDRMREDVAETRKILGSVETRI